LTDGSGSDPDGDPITYRWDYKGSINGNLVSRWNFDENLGNITYDTSGVNNNDGVLKPASPVWTTGKVGNALQFNGADDYVEVPDLDSISVGNSDYTIEAWIYPDDTSGIKSVVAKLKDMTDKEYALSVYDGKLNLQVEKDGNNAYAETNTAPVVLDAWQHIAVSFDSSVTTPVFYHNGVSIAQTDNITVLPDQSFDNLCVGKWGGTYNNYFFDGKIDEVKIYNRVLSKDEIENLYEFGMGTLISDPFSLTPAFTPNTIGVYHIDLTVTDSYGGFDTDTISITVSNPTICGDDNIQCPNSSGLCEECDGTDDALCPGECVAPGETRECLCPQSMPEWREVHPKTDQ
jgi:hypothetical protein